MRSTSHARLLSTRAPVTSVIDQSSSAPHQSNIQSTRISHLEQSGGWTGSPTTQGQSNIYQQFNGSTQQAMSLKNVRPLGFQIGSSPTFEHPEIATTPKTPVLFTVNATRSKISSSLSHIKRKEINEAQYNNTSPIVNTTSKSNNSTTNPILSYNYLSRPPSSDSKNYPLRQNSGNLGDYHTPNFISTPNMINTGYKTLNRGHQQMIPDTISPIYYRTSRSSRQNEKGEEIIRPEKEITNSDRHLLSQNFQVQASDKAMEFVAGHEKALNNPKVGRSSQRTKRSASASRPQYSRPSHPAFIKEVDMTLHKLQANAIYSSTIDMLSNNDINHFYTAPPAHFKLMRKKWKASEPPSLPPPPSSDDTLPDGIPVLTANPHELRDQYLANMKPVQPIPSSSVGFFVESEPQVPKKRYSLRRVNSAGSSSSNAQKHSNSYVNIRELKQRNLRLLRSSCSEALTTSDRPQLRHDACTFQHSALLTPDLSMQTETVTDVITTPVRNMKNDKLTIDELRHPVQTRKLVHEEIEIDNLNTIKSDKDFARSRSAGECSASQDNPYDSIDKPLLNVRSIVDTRHRLRPSLASCGSSSKRSCSAQPLKSNRAHLVSQSNGLSHTSSNASAYKRSIGHPSMSLSSRQDASSITDLSNQHINKNIGRKRPLSSGDVPSSGVVYKTINGEKPIARGFSTRATRLMHNSMNSPINIINSSLRPDVSLTPYQSISTSKALAVSAVIPTSSLALSMASSYIQSQARGKYNMAIRRLQAPTVTLESTPSQRSKTRTASTSTRHSRRTIRMQSRSITDQSINTIPPTIDVKNEDFGAHSVELKGLGYFARSRNAKIGTTELKDAYTETGSYRSNTEISDARSSLDHPISSGKQKSIQTFDETLGQHAQSSSFKEMLRKTHSGHTRSQSSSSMRTTDKYNTMNSSSLKRSHSATFHPRDNNTALASTYSISTTDMLAARRLITPQANPRFTDHKRDVITRHLADIAAIPIYPKERRSSAEKSNRPASPSIIEMLKGLDIPTINSAESSAIYDQHIFSDDQMANGCSYDPSISRNKSAIDTFTSMCTLPSTELDEKNLSVYPQSSEFIQLLGTNTFPNSSTTLEMYIGGLNHQEIDLQHHLFSKQSLAAASSEPTKGEKEEVKKKPIRKTCSSSASASASSSTIYAAKRRRSSSSSYSNSRQAQAMSNSADQIFTNDLEPQVSLTIQPHAQMHSSTNADMVLEDLDTDGVDTDCVINSAVCTSNYKETVLLRRKAPDGHANLAMVNTADILYNSTGVKTAQTLPVQPTNRSLSASTHRKIHSTKRATTIFNYPSITGTFPLYVNEEEKNTQPHTVLQTDNKSSPPKSDHQHVSRSLPPNKQLHSLEKSTSSLAQNNRLSNNYTSLSTSVSAAMARRAYKKQSNNENLNTIMHKTTTSDISGLQGSPTVFIPRDLSDISQRQSIDKELNLAKDGGKDVIYQSPIIFTSLVGASPPQQPCSTNTIVRSIDENNQNVFSSSQHLRRSHTSADNLRKDSAYRAQSNRLMESEKDKRLSVLLDTQYGSKVNRSDGKADSHTRQYGRSQIRPVSSSSLSGSMTAMRVSRCKSSCATRYISSAGRERKTRA